MKSILRKIYVYYLGKRLGRFGNSSWMSPFGTYPYKNKIYIGNHVYIGKGAHLSASAGIVIGDGVTIGPEFMVMGGDHKFDEVGVFMHQMTTGGINKRIVIEDDVWIGARVVLLKGVTIGEGAVVGAGSIVTKKIPPYAVYAGNPAKRIGMRFTEDQLKNHLQIIGSRYSLSDIKAFYEK